MAKSLKLDGKGQYLARIDNISSSPGAYNQGTYNDDIYNFPNNLKVGNNWTLGFWVKPEDYKEFGTIFSVGEKDDKNLIEISITSVPEETLELGKRPAELRALIKDGDGTTIKHYGWPNHFQEDVWTHTFLQWDGVDLKAFKNALTTTTGVIFVDASGVMSDFPARKIFYGSTVPGDLATFSGTIGHFGMWGSLVGSEEFGTVVSGGFAADLAIASGTYISQGDLQHYWRPGDDPVNIGKDFTTSGTPIDLDKERNINGSNITSDEPT